MFALRVHVVHAVMSDAVTEDIAGVRDPSRAGVGRCVTGGRRRGCD